MHAANATHRALVRELAVPPPLPLLLGRTANGSSRRGSDDAVLGLPRAGSVLHGLSGRAAGGGRPARTTTTGGATAAQSRATPSIPTRSYKKENAPGNTGAGRGALRRAGRDARGRHLDTAADAAPGTAALGPIPIPKFQPSSSFSSGQDAENEDNNVSVHGRAKGGASCNVKGGPHGDGSSNNVNAAPGGSFSSQFHTAKSAAAAEAARSRAAAAAAGAAGRGWSKGSDKPLVAFGTATAASDAAAAARTAPSSSSTKGQRRTRSKRKKARPDTATTHEGGQDEATGNNKDDAGIADKSSPKSASDFDAKQEPMHSDPVGEIHGNAANSRSMYGLTAADHRFPASGFVLGEGSPAAVHSMTPPPPPSPVVGPAGLPEEPLYKVITPRRGRTTIVRLPSYASHTQDEDDSGAGADADAGVASTRTTVVQAPPKPSQNENPSKNSSSKFRSNASSAPNVPAVDSAATATASAAAVGHADGSVAAPATTATNSGGAAGSATVAPEVAGAASAGAGASEGSDASDAPGAGVTLYRAKGDVTWMADGANYGAHSYNAVPSEVPEMVELAGAGIGGDGSSSGIGSAAMGAWNLGPEIGTKCAMNNIGVDESSTSCVPGWPEAAKERETSPWYASEVPSHSNENAIRTIFDSQVIPSDSPASPLPVSSSSRELPAEPLTPTEEEEGEEVQEDEGTAPVKPTTRQEPEETGPSNVSASSAPNTTGADHALGSAAKAAATSATSTAPSPADIPTAEGAVGAHHSSTEQTPHVSGATEQTTHVSGANGGALGSTGSTTEALSDAELDLITLLVLKGLADQGKDPTSSNNNSNSNSGINSRSSSSAGWIANPPWPALACPFSHYPGDDGSNGHFQSASAANVTAASEQRAQAAEFAKASTALLSLVQEALVSGRAALDKERDLLARETALSRREVHGKQRSHSSTAVGAVQDGSGSGGGDNAADSLAPKGSSNQSHHQHQDELTSDAASVVGQEQNAATAAAALRESVRLGVREGLTSGLRESLQREMRFAWMQSGYAGSSVYGGDFNNRNSGDHHDHNPGGTSSGVAATAEDYDNRDIDANVAWFGNSGVAGGRNLRESVRASVVASFEAGAAHTSAAAAATLHGRNRGNTDSISGATGRPQESGSADNGEASFGGASDASAEPVAAAKERAEPSNKDDRLLAAETGSITTAGGSSVSTNATFKSNWGRMLQGGSRWHDEVPPADH